MNTSKHNTLRVENEITSQARSWVVDISHKQQCWDDRFSAPLYFAIKAVICANSYRVQTVRLGPDEAARLLLSGSEYALEFVRREIPEDQRYQFEVFFENYYCRSGAETVDQFQPVLSTLV